jgi:hypothetical protein
MRLEASRHLSVCRDRETPVVERDELGQKLGTEAMALARDRVDTELHESLFCGTGRTGAVRERQRPYLR